MILQDWIYKIETVHVLKPIQNSRTKHYQTEKAVTYEEGIEHDGQKVRRDKTR